MEKLRYGTKKNGSTWVKLDTLLPGRVWNGAARHAIPIVRYGTVRYGTWTVEGRVRTSNRPGRPYIAAAHCPRHHSPALHVYSFVGNQQKGQCAVFTTHYNKTRLLDPFNYTCAGHVTDTNDVCLPRVTSEHILAAFTPREAAFLGRRVGLNAARLGHGILAAAFDWSCERGRKEQERHLK